MDFSFKPRLGRPKCADPLNEIESIPVTGDVKAKIMQLKNQGLMINEMTREFFSKIIKQAEDGKIDGVSLKKHVI